MPDGDNLRHEGGPAGRRRGTASGSAARGTADASGFERHGNAFFHAQVRETDEYEMARFARVLPVMLATEKWRAAI